MKEGRVVLVDGDAMFNRPGPRLVLALEWLERVIGSLIVEGSLSRRMGDAGGAGAGAVGAGVSGGVGVSQLDGMPVLGTGVIGGLTGIDGLSDRDDVGGAGSSADKSTVDGGVGRGPDPFPCEWMPPRRVVDSAAVSAFGMASGAESGGAGGRGNAGAAAAESGGGVGDTAGGREVDGSGMADAIHAASTGGASGAPARTPRPRSSLVKPEKRPVDRPQHRLMEIKSAHVIAVLAGRRSYQDPQSGCAQPFTADHSHSKTDAWSL